MMKNKLFMAGLLTALVCGLALSGCENKILDVKPVYDKANAVASVTAVQTTNPTTYVIVSWDAVENGGDYEVYIKQEGAKTVSYFGYGQNDDTYAPADGTVTPNANPDKWSFCDTIENSPLRTGKSYYFGVKTSPLNFGPNDTASDITWITTALKIN
jgi:hypothetical protein